jgi:hypothetical protein
MPNVTDNEGPEAVGHAAGVKVGGVDVMALTLGGGVKVDVFVRL